MMPTFVVFVVGAIGAFVVVIFNVVSEPTIWIRIKELRFVRG